MTSPILPNVWHLRRVADKSAKSCWICYKSSTSVLITPDSKDHFYICPGHLKDKSFCTPDEDEAAALKEKKEKEELEKEKAKVIAEFEEKKRVRDKRKADRKKEKDKDKDKDKKKEDKKDEEEEKKEDEEKEKKIKDLEKAEETVVDIPRIYSLHKSFFNQRLSRLRNAEMAKRQQEMIRNPNAFPSVPTGDPSKPR